MSLVADVIGRGGVAGVAALTFVETFFPPIPSEVVMPLSGVAAARGTMPLAGAILAGVIGSMGGNIAFFVAARRLGAERFAGWVDRHGRWLTLDRASVEHATRLFQRGGPWLVGLGRCLPGIRSIVSVPAGLAGMRWTPFLLWSTLGTTIWVGALTLAGYRLGRASLSLIERWLSPVSTAVLAAAFLIYVVRLATWRPHR